MDDLTKIYKDDEIQNGLEIIYRQYQEVIKIFIGQIETLQNRFPVEILNEIRAIFSHIAKIYVCDKKSVAKENLEKAKGHLKRAQLDSFKYLCYAYDKYYKNFMDSFKDVDLSYVNNGDFILDLSIKYTSALQKSKAARYIESTVDNVVASYEAYEEAYIEYTLVYKLIVDNLSNIHRVQRKEKKQQEELNNSLATLQKSNQELLSQITLLEEKNKKEKLKSKIFTYVSIVLGIASVLLGIITLVK